MFFIKRERAEACPISHIDWQHEQAESNFLAYKYIHNTLKKSEEWSSILVCYVAPLHPLECSS